jgi:hypothetical protein
MLTVGKDAALSEVIGMKLDQPEPTVELVTMDGKGLQTFPVTSSKV